MNINFSNFFWSLFPAYYKENDTYVDSNGQGFFERYMMVFGEEIEQSIRPLCEDYLNIISSDDAASKFLIHQAYTLGNPPSPLYDDVTIRRVHKFIMGIYKIKGRALSFEAYFRLLGYEVSVSEIPCPPAINYDSGQWYDNHDINYDMNGCCSCSDFDVTITGRYQSSDPLDQTDIDLITKVIDFLTPINATPNVII